ncbi:hypothetical protein Tco_1062617 [Tanacetum coccineum]
MCTCVARIMPPRRFKKKSVKRIVEKRVAKAIEEYEKTRTDSNNAGGSGSANTRGTVAPEMHGCVVRTKDGSKRLSSVLRLQCAEDDKFVSTEKKKIEKYIRGFPEGIKGNVTSSKPATLHDAINMAPRN